MSSLLSSLPSAQPDPFFVLNDLYAKDPRPEKVNLGIGIYKDISGKTPFMEVFLKEVEAFVPLARAKSVTAEYLSIQGLSSYNEEVVSLVFGKNASCIQEERVGVLQTPGGTGALCIGAEFLGVELGGKVVAMSDPTWANHPNIFQRAGFELVPYAYRDSTTNRFDLEKTIASIKTIPTGSVILLHASCHNPTGIDPTDKEFETIIHLVAERNLIPFFDLAYQGLGRGIDEDAFPIRYAAQLGLEFLVAASFSKNLSLYQHRVGALLLVGKTRENVQNGVELIKAKIIRATYSNPPALGAWATANILKNADKRTQWEAELKGVRERIQDMRSALTLELEKRGIDAESLKLQQGMFCFTSLTTPQVLKLREKFGIYMTNDGRVNLAGLSEKNVTYVADAMKSIV